METKVRSLLTPVGATSGMNKEARFNQMNEQRKLKREDLIMKRRGLNFIMDSTTEAMDDE